MTCCSKWASLAADVSKRGVVFVKFANVPIRLLLRVRFVSTTNAAYSCAILVRWRCKLAADIGSKWTRKVAVLLSRYKTVAAYQKYFTISVFALQEIHLQSTQTKELGTWIPKRTLTDQVAVHISSKYCIFNSDNITSGCRHSTTKTLGWIVDKFAIVYYQLSQAISCDRTSWSCHSWIPTDCKRCCCIIYKCAIGNICRIYFQQKSSSHVARIIDEIWVLHIHKRISLHT